MRGGWLLCAWGLAGCASAPSTLQDWPTAFADDIRKIAGDSLVDCGFHDLLNGTPVRAQRQGAFYCVQNALREGRAFKYGTFRLPMDSHVWEAYVSPGDGSPWLLVFDQMFFEESTQYFRLRCREVTVNRSLVISHDDCIDHDEKLEPVR